MGWVFIREDIHGRYESTRLSDIRVHFYALDAAFEKGGTEYLRSFLSEANPFLWKRRRLTDPAVYEEFTKAFDERFGSQGAASEEARSFARDYFSTRNGEYCWTEGNLVAAFEVSWPRSFGSDFWRRQRIDDRERGRDSTWSLPLRKSDGFCG